MRIWKPSRIGLQPAGGDCMLHQHHLAALLLMSIYLPMHVNLSRSLELSGRNWLWNSGKAADAPSIRLRSIDSAASTGGRAAQMAGGGDGDGLDPLSCSLEGSEKRVGVQSKPIGPSSSELPRPVPPPSHLRQRRAAPCEARCCSAMAVRALAAEAAVDN